MKVEVAFHRFWLFGAYIILSLSCVCVHIRLMYVFRRAKGSHWESCSKFELVPRSRRFTMCARVEKWFTFHEKTTRVSTSRDQTEKTHIHAPTVMLLNALLYVLIQRHQGIRRVPFFVVSHFLSFLSVYVFLPYMCVYIRTARVYILFVFSSTNDYYYARFCSAQSWAKNCRLG